VRIFHDWLFDNLLAAEAGSAPPPGARPVAFAGAARA